MAPIRDSSTSKSLWRMPLWTTSTGRRGHKQPNSGTTCIRACIFLIVLTNRTRSAESEKCRLVLIRAATGCPLGLERYLDSLMPASNIVVNGRGYRSEEHTSELQSL